MIPTEPATKVARARLRPRDRGAILDAAFRLYRNEFFTLLAIVAVIYVPVEVLVQALSLKLLGYPTSVLEALSSGFGGVRRAGVPAGTGVAGLLAYYIARNLVSGLRGVLMYPAKGAIATAVEDQYLGRPTSLAGAYNRIAKLITPLLGLMGLQLLIQLAIYVLPTSLSQFMSARSTFNPMAPALSFLAGLGVLVYLYVSVRLQLAVPAAVVERLGPIQALSRSWALVQGNWWRTFGLLVFTLTLLSIVISDGPGFLIKWVVGSFVHLDATADQAVTLAVGGITTLLFLPLEYLVITLYYFDLRVRRESLDLEYALEQRYPDDGSPQPDPARESVPVVPRRGTGAPTLARPILGKTRRERKRTVKVAGSGGPDARTLKKVGQPPAGRGRP
jgi:hypothetical protein